MANLNFGSLATAQGVATGSKRLKSWEIHKVKFMGCKVETLQGKKDPTAVYKLFVTRFENDNGYYEERIFFPDMDKATIRPEFENSNGHKYEGPSPWEQIQTYVMQLLENINPDKIPNLRAAAPKFKSFDDLFNAIIKLTDPNKEKEVFIKLIGKTDKDGRINPAFPRICGVNKEGVLFVSDNFISTKEGILGFSDYEEGQMKKAKEAKPTNMAKVDEETSSSDDIDDFDDLL
jgi:hypothetical protein